MNKREAFNKVILTHENMALATCIEGKPNVRVITFGYDENTEGAVYFTTFGGAKLAEFEANPNVTFVTIPNNINEEIQIRIHGKIKKSEKSLDEIANLIIKKQPSFKEILNMGNDSILIYEILFDEAYVTIGMTDAEILTFK